MASSNELKQEKSIATELLHDVKAQARRWMIAFFSMLILWGTTVGVFAWYLYQHVF